MILGWIMARRYVLSRNKNERIEHFLTLQREGRLEELSGEEEDELIALKASLR